MTDESAVTIGADVRKTTTLLADGRELFYYDEAGTDADRSVLVDRRPLPTAEPSSTMRFDPILDEWVTTAGHRQTRTYLPPDNACPLDPSRDDYQSEIPARDYDVVVFQNRFPSFAETSVIDQANYGDDRRNGQPTLFLTQPGFGR